MTLTLILIRHAKSDWDHPGLEDHDRPLNERGRASAPRIGAWLAARGFLPQAVLCSSARRTRETWEGIASRLPDPPEPVHTRGLYLASPAAILNAMRDTEAASLAVIGHNPGIGSLARSLCATPPDHPKFGVYPTGATLVLRLPARTWADVTPGTGEVAAFAVPRELPDPD
ncbi:histidine phosphatase family protein [Roseibacterium sp. SDUM158017]|uniref:SixA phosphatase family protein n=1 Tax=Roseicyclus salinarum TaxID=3036773 RepID=UPI00241505C6|nr:histidine phosphatase family protein [Roseibacterium sp. SDUM158017]MDG4650228.1 histidine phosphatase family protein [Roseibacterium sp. SDUM158017]